MVIVTHYYSATAVKMAGANFLLKKRGPAVGLTLGGRIPPFLEFLVQNLRGIRRVVLKNSLKLLKPFFLLNKCKFILFVQTKFRYQCVLSFRKDKIR